MIDCSAMLVPEPLPEVFRERFAGLEEQCPATRAGDVYAGCFGCGQAHPSGLRVRCFKVEGGVERYEAPNVWALKFVLNDALGGGGPRSLRSDNLGKTHASALYLDEVLAGAVVRATGRLAVTGELTVRYVRPVPLATPLAGRAQLVADRERYADVEGRIEDLATAAVLATARGRFVFMRG